MRLRCAVACRGAITVKARDGATVLGAGSYHGRVGSLRLTDRARAQARHGTIRATIVLTGLTGVHPTAVTRALRLSAADAA